LAADIVSVGNRIRYVDGLRALAVLFVLADHATVHAPPAIKPYLLLEGTHGVDLFFVLSGFCLAYPYLERVRSGAAFFDLPRYFAKRLVRIVPPFYAAIAVLTTVAVALTLTHRTLPESIWPLSFAPVNVLKQALFLDWRTPLLNGSFWTLFVEFRWYFVFPFALLAYVRYPRLMIVAACAAPAIFLSTRLHVVDLATLMPFCLGIVAADLHIRRHSFERLAVFFVLPAIVLGLVLEPFTVMPYPFGGEGHIFNAQTNPGWQLAMFFFVLACGASRPLQRVLSIAPLTAIGIASYSIYLVHEPVVNLVETHLRFAPGLAALVGAIVALGAGCAFWAIFERPWTETVLKERATRSVRGAVAQVFGLLQVAPVPPIGDTGVEETRAA
jgi:peptidoglycan/LPS O-acetylase OafA/YrhL